MVVFFGTLLIVPIILIKLPDDYFSHHHRAQVGITKRHPLVHAALIVIKNLIAITLIAAGIMMLVLPGQGLLTIVAGLLLLDFPGKYQLEREIVQRDSVLTAINWIRARANKC